jgi:hypothetical protein
LQDKLICPVIAQLPASAVSFQQEKGEQKSSSVNLGIIPVYAGSNPTLFINFGGNEA